MMYRFPILESILGQSVIASLHYKSIEGTGSSGRFVGAGISYIDDLWSSIDSLVNKISFLNYPKTVEMNFEYVPVVASSERVTGLQAYVASLKMFLFLNQKLSVDAGIYSHSFKYTTSTVEFKNETVFSELGLGYRF